MDGGAAERFFKFGEAGPGVGFGRVVGGDTPEVEGFKTLFFGVEERSSEEADGGRELFIGGICGGLHIEAGGVF